MGKIFNRLGPNCHLLNEPACFAYWMALTVALMIPVSGRSLLEDFIEIHVEIT